MHSECSDLYRGFKTSAQESLTVLSVQTQRKNSEEFEINFYKPGLTDKSLVSFTVRDDDSVDTCI
jgi:hypothetical protein